MSSEQSAVINVFCSYSDADRADFHKLERHLASLERTGSIRILAKHKVKPGQEYEREIEAQLAQARLILLLVSSNFISSDDCYGRDLVKALQRHHDDNVVVVPIILKPCTWDDLAFSSLQILPRDKVPVSLCRNRDEAFDHIVKEIKAIVTDLQRYGKDYMEPLVPKTERSSPSTGFRPKAANPRSRISQATNVAPLQTGTRDRKQTNTLANAATITPSKKYVKTLPQNPSTSVGSTLGRFFSFLSGSISGQAFNQRCRRWKGNSAWLLFFYVLLDLGLLPYLMYQRTLSLQITTVVFGLSAALFFVGVFNKENAVGLSVAVPYFPVWLAMGIWYVNTYLHFSWSQLSILILILIITIGRLFLFQWRSPFGQR